MTNAQDAQWTSIPPYALWLLGLATLGWIIGPLLGFYWGKRSQIQSERRKARHEFFSVLAAQKSGLDALSRQKDKLVNPNEDVFFKESVEAMTAAAYRIQNFVAAKEWLCLSAVLKEYQSHKEQYTGATRRVLDEKSGVSFVQRLQKFIDRFDECISK